MTAVIKSNKMKEKEIGKKTKPRGQQYKLETVDDYETIFNIEYAKFLNGEIDEKKMNTIIIAVNAKKGIASAKELARKVIEKINIGHIRIQNLVFSKYREYILVIKRLVDDDTFKNIMQLLKEIDKKYDHQVQHIEDEILKIVSKIKSIDLDDLIAYSTDKMKEIIKFLFTQLDPKSKDEIRRFINDYETNDQ